MGGLTKAMRKRAVRLAAEAISQHDDANQVAAHVAGPFDIECGTHWQCAVAGTGDRGRLGVRAWIINNNYISFAVGSWDVALWQSHKGQPQAAVDDDDYDDDDDY